MARGAARAGAHRRIMRRCRLLRPLLRQRPRLRRRARVSSRSRSTCRHHLHRFLRLPVLRASIKSSHRARPNDPTTARRPLLQCETEEAVVSRLGRRRLPPRHDRFRSATRLGCRSCRHVHECRCKPRPKRCMQSRIWAPATCTCQKAARRRRCRRRLRCQCCSRRARQTNLRSPSRSRTRALCARAASNPTSRCRRRRECARAHPMRRAHSHRPRRHPANPLRQRFPRYHRCLRWRPHRRRHNNLLLLR